MHMLCAYYINSRINLSPHISVKSSLSYSKNTKLHNIFMLNSSTDETDKEESLLKDNDTYGKQGVVSYDLSESSSDINTFARGDILSPQYKALVESKKAAFLEEKDKFKDIISSKSVKVSELDDDARPTGYANDQDDDPAWVPIRNSDENVFVQFLKEVYIGSPYDSDKKKQARYVIRNITGISLAIGLIFTGIWYAFPGKTIVFMILYMLLQDINHV